MCNDGGGVNRIVQICHRTGNRQGPTSIRTDVTSYLFLTLFLTPEGWPSWVDWGGWLYTEMVYPHLYKRCIQQGHYTCKPPN